MLLHRHVVCAVTQHRVGIHLLLLLLLLLLFVLVLLLVERPQDAYFVVFVLIEVEIVQMPIPTHTVKS